MENIQHEEKKCLSDAFLWSPLCEQRSTVQNVEFNNTMNETKDCYPNCDTNVWLRSCEKEIIEPLEGKISGKIPEWLSGSLIRNGPGSLKVGDNTFDHLFDSSALLHRFGIRNGQVTYQCRFLQSDTFKRNWAANRIVFTEFGTKSVPDPCHTIFRRIGAVFNSDTSDNSMISVYPFGDELYAFNETPIIHKIDSESLSTEGKVNIGKYVSILHHTSHPHVMEDGTVYNLGTSLFLTGLHHTIVCFPKDGKGDTKAMFEQSKIVATIPVRWPLYPSYMHTFGITENYFIIVEQPLSVSVPGIVTSKLKNEPLAGCFKWYQDEYPYSISTVARQKG